MSFWNLYTEQNKTPTYIATDYNKLRSTNRRKTSQTLSDTQNNKTTTRMTNCSDETTRLEDCAEENQNYFRHFTLNVPQCHEYMDVYENCVRQRREM